MDGPQLTKEVSLPDRLLNSASGGIKENPNI
jgi:hypothetical protein